MVPAKNNQSLSTKGGARPGAGRKKGVPNKITADIKALAQVHTAAAMKELARLATKADSEAARVAAIKELFDRGYGKSKQPLVGGDEGDQPLTLKVITRRILHMALPAPEDDEDA